MTAIDLVLEDPEKYDYTQYIRTKLSNQDVSSVRLEVFKPVLLVEVLNYVLAKYYTFVRTLVPDYKVEIDIVFHKTGYKSQSHLAIPQSSETFPINKDPIPESVVHNLGVAAVGGTFDHLHDGHKILLSLAVFVSQTYLIIGITGSGLLKNKKYQEVLELFDIRTQLVISFIKKLAVPVNYQIYEINDVCGPTGFVSDIDTLVVSGESIKGGAFVNNYRKEKGFNELEIISINVIGSDVGDSSNSWQGKLSSTDIRKQEYERIYGKEKTSSR